MNYKNWNAEVFNDKIMHILCEVNQKNVLFKLTF